MHKVHQAALAARALGQHQHALPLTCCQRHMRFQLHQRVFSATHRRHHGHGLELGKSFFGGLGRGAQGQLRVVFGAGIKLLGAQEQGVGRQGGPVRVGAHDAIAVAGVKPEAVKCRLQVAVQNDGRRRAEVVEDGGGLVKEQRQVVLNAGRGYACAHVLVNAAAGRVALQQLTPAAAELGARGLVHGELASGKQPHFRHRVQAALAVGVECADAVDLIVKQIHAKRHL